MPVPLPPLPTAPPIGASGIGFGFVGGRPDCPAPGQGDYRTLSLLQKIELLEETAPEPLTPPGSNHRCAILRDLGKLPHVFWNQGQGEWRKAHLASVLVARLHRVLSSDQCVSLSLDSRCCHRGGGGGAHVSMWPVRGPRGRGQGLAHSL